MKIPKQENEHSRDYSWLPLVKCNLILHDELCLDLLATA